MNNKKIRPIQKITLALLILIAATMNTYPWWNSNHTELAFGGTGGSISSIYTIEYYIVKGAVSFLDSYDNLVQYLKKTEALSIDGGNSVELKVLLEKTSLSLRQSNEYYRKLYALAAITPLNMSIIEMLKHFDYDTFSKDNGEFINMSIYEEVKSYLVVGDILGIYAELIAKTDTLLVLIDQLTRTTNSGQVISPIETWKINHLFATTLLFGQIPAQVFYSISKAKTVALQQ